MVTCTTVRFGKPPCDEPGAELSVEPAEALGVELLSCCVFHPSWASNEQSRSSSWALSWALSWTLSWSPSGTLFVEGA